MGQQWKNDVMHLTADESRHSMQFLFSKLKKKLSYNLQLNWNSLYIKIIETFLKTDKVLAYTYSTNSDVATFESYVKTHEGVFNDSRVIFIHLPSFRLRYFRKYSVFGDFPHRLDGLELTVGGFSFSGIIPIH